MGDVVVNVLIGVAVLEIVVACLIIFVADRTRR
jgi:hypothetical protein